MARHGSGADVRRPRGLAATALATVLVVVGLLGWAGWVVGSDRESFLPWVGTWCTERPTVTVTTTAAMEPVLREVADDAQGACATFRVTAEAPEATARRFEAGGTAAPDLWVPDSALLARQVATASGGRVSVGATVASTPVVLAVPDGQQAPEPVAWGSTIVARNTRLPDPSTSTVGRVTLMAGLAELDALPAAQRSAALAGIGGMLSRVVPEETLLTAHVRGGEAAVFPTTEQQVQQAAVSGLAVRSATTDDPDARVPRRDDAFRPSGGRGSADPRAHRGCRAGRAARRRLPHAHRPDTDHRRRAVPRHRRCHGHAGAGEGRRADVDGHRHAHPAAHRHRHLRLDGPAGRPRARAHASRSRAGPPRAPSSCSPTTTRSGCGPSRRASTATATGPSCSPWHRWAPTTSGPSWRSRWERWARSSVVTRASTTRSRLPTRRR